MSQYNRADAPALLSSLSTDSKRSPMTDRSHPAHNVMRRKSDTEIVMDIKAMIGRKALGDLFIGILSLEAVSAYPYQQFCLPKKELAALLTCSTKDISRAVKELRPLIIMSRHTHELDSDLPDGRMYYEIDWMVFNAFMKTFYSRRDRLEESQRNHVGDKLSHRKLNTMSSVLTNASVPRREALCRNRSSKFTEHTTSNPEAIAGSRVEGAGWLDALAEAGALLKSIRRRDRNGREQLAQRIVRAKFPQLPEELTAWLAECAPQLDEETMHYLVEATFRADPQDPMDVIKRFQIISWSIDL